MYSETKVLHPLPRVGELDVSLDSDKRAVYFQQAAYGVPIRMALISLLLGKAKEERLQAFEGGFAAGEHPLYDRPLAEGLRCGNPNCIVHEPSEANYVRNKFALLKPAPGALPRLRCFYCETDAQAAVAADRRSKHYSTEPTHAGPPADVEGIVYFRSEADARAAGYRQAQPRRGVRKAATSA
jgi:hypothetical protein